MTILGHDIEVRKIKSVSEITRGKFGIYVDDESFSFIVKLFGGMDDETVLSFVSHDEKRLEAERQRLLAYWKQH